MRRTPRHLFLPGVPPQQAYVDESIYTKTDAHGTSISAASQPRIVAMMLEQLDVRPGQRIMEAGAGTGYNAALLAAVVGDSGRAVTIDVDGDGGRSGPTRTSASPPAPCSLSATSTPQTDSERSRPSSTTPARRGPSCEPDPGGISGSLRPGMPTASAWCPGWTGVDAVVSSSHRRRCTPPAAGTPSPNSSTASCQTAHQPYGDCCHHRRRRCPNRLLHHRLRLSRRGSKTPTGTGSPPSTARSAEFSPHPDRSSAADNGLPLAAGTRPCTSRHSVSDNSPPAVDSTPQWCGPGSPRRRR